MPEIKIFLDDTRVIMIFIHVNYQRNLIQESTNKTISTYYLKRLKVSEINRKINYRHLL